MNNAQAVLNILKAYKTFRVTDQFGDIPYSDAGKAYTGDAKFTGQNMMHRQIFIKTC